MSKLSVIPAIAGAVFAGYAGLLLCIYGIHNLQVASIILWDPNRD